MNDLPTEDIVELVVGTCLLVILATSIVLMFLTSAGGIP